MVSVLVRFQGFLKHLDAVHMSFGVEMELHHAMVFDVDVAQRAEEVAANGVGSSDLTVEGNK